MESDLKNLKEKESRYFFSTYKRVDVLIDRGEGCWLVTKSGKRILDMFAGLAVNVLGYNHPKLNAVIERQIHKFVHISNFFYQEPQINLAEKLINLSGFSRIFFTNSGTEAIETSIKIVRQSFRNSEKKKLISFTGSYHGRTYGSLSLTYRHKYKQGFEPFLPDVIHLKFNSLDELENAIDRTTAAVYLEFIQGEGGVNVVNSDFVKELKDLRDKYGFLLVADEIQSGVGRTGKYHSYEYFGIVPDIIALAKGIGGGFPLGAVLGNEKVARAFDTGMHGSTFGGNPVAASCGCVIYDELAKGLLAEVNNSGNYLRDNLKKIKSEFPKKILAVEGLGLMVGVKMSFQAQILAEQMLEKDVLINCTNGNVIRLLPPFLITKPEIDLFIDAFRAVLSARLPSENSP